MARMLKPEKRNRGLYRRCSVKVYGETQKVNLGYITAKAASFAFGVIEDLESLKMVDGNIAPELAQKIKRLDPDLQSQLLRVGLVRKLERPKTLEQLFDACYEMSLKTINHGSARNYRSTQRQIEKYFGSDRRIDTITQGCVKEFIAAKNETSERSTIGNYLKRGAEAFSFAVQKKWISDNPFQNLPERKQYPIELSAEKKRTQEELVTDEVVAKLLACRKSLRSEQENREWNTLVAILRWTGCRIAEALILRWEDIDFELKEIRLRGKRAANQRAASESMRVRMMPLWPQLVDVLSDLRDNSDGSPHLLNEIGGLASKPEFDSTDSSGRVIRAGRWSTNLATTFKKILKRNGITPWPQPFHALRSFRINEMERDPNLRTVEIREYTGNSEATARKHYSRVSREDRQRAAKRLPIKASGPTVDDGSHQKGSDRIAKKMGLPKTPRKQRSELIRTESEKNQVHPRGFEPLTFGSVVG
ncbi:phage integrase SAM-like domain-containing protein [bacterium]|nr:phage integrase SAM-like domain-containing protein [bacterium]